VGTLFEVLGDALDDASLGVTLALRYYIRCLGILNYFNVSTVLDPRAETAQVGP
jgi:hypothetical protein